MEIATLARHVPVHVTRTDDTFHLRSQGISSLKGGQSETPSPHVNTPAAIIIIMPILIIAKLGHQPLLAACPIEQNGMISFGTADGLGQRTNKYLHELGSLAWTR